MFDRRVSQYLGFQRVFLVLIAAVGLARLGLSLAGLPNATVTWFSMNVPLWAATLYYGVRMHTSGFGSYKQLLPLGFFQILVLQAVAALGIVLAIAGHQNIFAAPEYSIRGQSQSVHLAAHLTIGIVVPTFLLWAVSSLVMLITKKVTGQPAPAMETER